MPRHEKRVICVLQVLISIISNLGHQKIQPHDLAISVRAVLFDTMLLVICTRCRAQDGLESKQQGDNRAIEAQTCMQAVRPMVRGVHRAIERELCFRSCYKRKEKYNADEL